jgi:hypothetical protein
MAFSQILKRTRKATVAMVELFNEDDAAGSNSNSILKANLDLPSSSQKIGADKPFVKIAGQIITNIETLIIDETGMVPTITLVFIDANGEFGGPAFPKKNLRLSVYLKTGNPKMMPLRGDYLITSIKSISNPNNRGKHSVTQEVTYLVKGELFIPRLYNNVSKSYSKLNSRDTLFRVAEELGLGFVENDFNTADNMTWINMNTSPFNFIKDVVTHAYSDDEAFFEAFISKELNLSMVQVSQQLLELEPDETFVALANPLDGDFTQNVKDNSTKLAADELIMANILTTDPSHVQSQNYILEASLISSQGKILKNNGYKKKIYYYDHNSTSEPINKFKDFFMSPINTPGANDDTLLIPEEEGLDEIGVKKWMDINYGNTHSQWNAARLLNNHNNNELNKIQLRTVTRGINSQVIRGMSIYTKITQKVAEYLQTASDPLREDNIDTSGLASNDNIVNPQLSGVYYVKGVKYYYDANTTNEKITTELFLAKREWLPSKIIID